LPTFWGLSIVYFYFVILSYNEVKVGGNYTKCEQIVFIIGTKFID